MRSSALSQLSKPSLTPAFSALGATRFRRLNDFIRASFVSFDIAVAEESHEHDAATHGVADVNTVADPLLGAEITFVGMLFISPMASEATAIPEFLEASK